MGRVGCFSVCFGGFCLLVYCFVLKHLDAAVDAIDETQLGLVMLSLVLLLGMQQLLF